MRIIVILLIVSCGLVGCGNSIEKDSDYSKEVSKGKLIEEKNLKDEKKEEKDADADKKKNLNGEDINASMDKEGEKNTITIDGEEYEYILDSDGNKIPIVHSTPSSNFNNGVWFKMPPYGYCKNNDGMPATKKDGICKNCEPKKCEECNKSLSEAEAEMGMCEECYSNLWYHCSGCGLEIHDGLIDCPKCGKYIENEIIQWGRDN